MDRGFRVESLSFREGAVVEVALPSSSPLAISARARFLVFLLCVLKIEGFIFEGRGRAAVVVLEEEEEVEGWARREDSWLVKARVEEVRISLARVLGRGMP